MVLYLTMDEMNDVQARIIQLKQRGWTLAAIAGELDVTPNAVEKWQAGDRHPNSAKAIFALLDQLAKQKRIPKKRRYAKNSHQL